MSTHPDLAAENAELRARLAEAEETIEAIRSGAVDALLTSGPAGAQVFTLQGAETPYRLLMESMNEGAATLAPDGTVLYCNRRFAEMAALPAEKIVGSSLGRCVALDQQKALCEMVARASTGAHKAEFIFSCDPGPVLPVLLSLSPIAMDPDAIAVVATDLSERKQHEEKLRQLNQALEATVRHRTAELQAIFDAAPVGLAIAQDPEARSIRGNPAIEQTLGLQREEELSLGAGQPASYRCLRDGREVPTEQLPMQRAARGETITGHVMDIVRPDGRTVTVYSNAVPLRDEQGRPRGSVGAFLDVTERNRQERALAEKARLLDLSYDAILVRDADDRITYWSRGAEELYGYSREEAWGKICHELLRTEFPEPVESIVAKLRHGNRWTGELVHIRRDGTRLSVSTRWALERTAQGQPAAILEINTDITERHQAEAALRESEERLKRSQEIAHLGSWELDLARKRLIWSDEVYRLFGLTPQEFGATYEAFLERVHPEDRQKVDDAYSGSLRANRDAYEVEHRIIRKDTGEVRVVHERCEHFRDTTGKIIRSVGMVQDITRRKQAEAALRDKEAELRAITEVTPVMLTRSSRDLHYLYANRAYASMLGTTPEQIIGKPIVEIMGEKGLATIRPRVEQVLQGQPVEYEDQVHFALAGKSRWLHAAYMPERDAQGHVVGWIASITDITERKQAEEALRRIEEERKIAEAVQVERQRFQEVLNMLPAYVVLLSPDYRVPFANRFFEERFGKAQDRHCYKYLFNRQETRETCESFKVLKTHAPHRWEWTGPDGRNYDISDFPFTDVDGSPLVMEVGLDVTERKKAEAELTRHREHLQELVHQRTAKLHETNEELLRFNRAMVGRELRMIELKQEINALCAALDRPPAYPLAAEQQQPKPTGAAP